MTSAKLVLVIEVKTVKGSGSPDDPVRAVTELWSLDGKRLTETESFTS